MNRRGFTLTEFLISLTVLALMGVALARILISDSRFVSRQDAMLTARQGARAALNTIVSELTLVGDSAVIAASRDSITVRVSYAFGVTCRSPNNSVKIASMMPIDSLVWASMSAPGIYWRQRSGYYRRLDGIIVAASQAGDEAYCTADSVRVLPGGRITRITHIGGFPEMPESLAVMSLYQAVTYKFAASTDLPGRRALWRNVAGGTAEELVTPFDTAASFAYLVGGPKAATLALRTNTITGTGLDSIRGVELRLYAASQQAAQGTADPQTFRLRTRIMFANKTR
jgi:prepilin-type N-terminal cleavage/methylation domain-containing protein